MDNNINNSNQESNNKIQNYNSISIKHFNESGPSLIHTETNLDSQDVYEQAVDAAFNTTGFGLQHWEFLERSYECKERVLSELYRFREEDGSYYQLKFSRELNNSVNKL